MHSLRLEYVMLFKCWAASYSWLLGAPKDYVMIVIRWLWNDSLDSFLLVNISMVKHKISMWLIGWILTTKSTNARTKTYRLPNQASPNHLPIEHLPIQPASHATTPPNQQLTHYLTPNQSTSHLTAESASNQRSHRSKPHRTISPTQRRNNTAESTPLHDPTDPTNHWTKYYRITSPPDQVLPNQTLSTYNWARAIPNQGCQARLHQPKPTSSCIHPRPLLPASLYK